ncbi:MAG: hypothetical protein ACRBBQ_12345 [Cognatishimia sp.]
MLAAGIFILVFCLMFAFAAQKAADSVNHSGLGILIYILAIPAVLGLFLWGAGLTFIGTDPRSDSWASQSARGKANTIKYDRVIASSDVRFYTKAEGSNPQWHKENFLPEPSNGICADQQGIGRDGKRAYILFYDSPYEKKGFVEVSTLRKLKSDEACNRQTGRVYLKAKPKLNAATHYVGSLTELSRSRPNGRNIKPKIIELPKGACVQVLETAGARHLKVQALHNGKIQTGYVLKNNSALVAIEADDNRCI